MSDDKIAETTVEGAEIQPIVAKIEEALADTPRIPALVALTYMILFMQYPLISMDQLYEGVQDVSRYVTFWLAALDNEETTEFESVPPEKLN